MQWSTDVIVAAITVVISAFVVCIGNICDGPDVELAAGAEHSR